MTDQLAPGRRTDLGVLRLQGAQITDQGDHRVVRSPSNPGFHWGNFILVTTGDPEDADRWLTAFERAFPDATHVAIDLPVLPDTSRYVALGLEVGTDDVLDSTELPELRPLAAGYQARELASSGDWEQVIRRSLAENAADGVHEPVGYERFIRDQAADRRALVEAGHAAFFGAFDGDELAAELGIVLLGDTARYQSVGTEERHRRKGLAGHLLGLAARWAGERGATEWVIVTESTNPAGRLYRSLGFTEAARTVQAYRGARA